MRITVCILFGPGRKDRLILRDVVVVTQQLEITLEVSHGFGFSTLAATTRVDQVFRMVKIG
jgi:hypothetical protein